MNIAVIKFYQLDASKFGGFKNFLYLCSRKAN